MVHVTGGHPQPQTCNEGKISRGATHTCIQLSQPMKDQQSVKLRGRVDDHGVCLLTISRVNTRKEELNVTKPLLSKHQH